MICSAKAKKIRIISTVITTALILAIFGANIYQCCSYREEVAAKIAEENEEIEAANKEILKKNNEIEDNKMKALNDSLKARNGKLCGHITYIMQDQVKMEKDYKCERSCKKEFRGNDRENCIATCFKRTEVDVKTDVDTCIYANSIDDAYSIIDELREPGFYKGKYLPRIPSISIPEVPDSIFPVLNKPISKLSSLDFYVSYFLQPEEEGKTRYREILNRFFFLDYGKFYGLKMVCAILFAHICLMFFIAYKESLYVALRIWTSEATKSRIIEFEVLKNYYGPVLLVPYISAFLYCASLNLDMIAVSFASLLFLPFYSLILGKIKDYISKSS